MTKDIERLEFEIQKEEIIIANREEEIANVSKGIGKIENILDTNKNTNYLTKLENN